MEKFPRNTKSPESGLIKKYRLFQGNNVALEKIAVHTSSSVPVGLLLKGILQDSIEIGKPIRFKDGGAVISNILNLEEHDGQLLLRTSTSTYRLRPESLLPAEKISTEDIDMIETAKGSTYRYLPDGTTQRFKKAENREYDPQTALVYVPDFEWVKKHAKPEILTQLGDNEVTYTQRLLTYVQNPLKDGRKVYIVDKTGKVVETNQEIKDTKGSIYLVFSKNNKTDFSIPVSHEPKIGFMTFDTRRYIDESTGELLRERHLGNKVIKIVRKEKKDYT